MFKTSVACNEYKSITKNFSSPVFEYLSELLKKRQTLAILDFGKTKPATLEYFQRFGSQFCVVDAFGLLSSFYAKPGETKSVYNNRLNRLTQDYLKLPENFKFDLILCWDGLNYLDATIVKFLIRFLESYRQPHTLIHSYIYTHRNIPCSAGEFEVLGSDLVSVNYKDNNQKPGYGYSPTDLNNMMKPHTVLKSVLLKSGIQEYLFHCQQF